MPLGSLVAANLADGRVEMQTLIEPVLRATAPNVVVWQRVVEEAQFECVRRHRRMLPDALFVYELDDYLGRIPEKSFHSGFMPPNLEARVAQGMALCDVVTTTTGPLAAWLRELGARDVRVAPNVIPTAKFRMRETRVGVKLRIGWGGGISHAGDLEMLRHAMTEIADEVIWVFLGMKPEDPPCRVEFEPGPGGPPAYLDTLAKLDLDLVLAPLEYNRFNECKSNLRLLEGGAVCAAAIAQRIAPYLTDNPPVVGYAEGPEDWTREIRRFIALPPSERQRRARALQAWVSRHYTAERRLHDRLAAWTRPPDTDGVVHGVLKSWRPLQPKDTGTDVTIVVQGLASWIDLPQRLRNLKIETTLEGGCRAALERGSHLLWLRPGTALTEQAWSTLRSVLADNEPVAGVVPLSSDGVNAYPQRNGHVPVDAAAAEIVSEDVAVRFKGRRLAMAVLGGPCILLHRTALSLFGTPDATGQEGNDEVAITEWSLRMHQKGWRLVQAADAYVVSQMPPQQCRETAGMRLHGRGLAPWMQAPSEELPAADREALDLLLLRRQWSGARPGAMGFEASYPVWAAFKGPIKYEGDDTGPFLKGFHRLAYGDPIPEGARWLLFVDDRTELKPGAERLLQQECTYRGDEVLAIYGDHEVIAQQNAVIPFFKTDFDLELLLGQDYITPVVAVRNEVLQGRSPQDPAELYECLLWIALIEGDNLQRQFCHIPEMLAARQMDEPERMAVDTMQRRVAIERQFGDAVEVALHEHLPGMLRVRRRWQAAAALPPLVSIIVLTRGGGWMLQPCINTVLKLTKYSNFEILVVGSGERAPEVGDLAVADPRVRVVDWVGPDGEVLPFNWSAKNNFAVPHARGDYLCFMNDDVRVAAPGWLDAMMGRAVQADVGAVGARLVHGVGAVQHVGVVVHRGINGHVHKGMPANQPGAYGWALLSHEATAVTGACMLVGRDRFDKAGGFLEVLSHNYNDVHFCMELRRRGYRNVVDVAAELLHNEGSTRPSPLSPEGADRMREEGAFMRAYDQSPDPYWNPNLGLASTNNGMLIHGLNRDMLDWRSDPPAPDAPRVLLVNDRPGMAGIALDLHRRGEVVFAADLSAFGLRLTAPQPSNVGAWDIRQPMKIRAALDALGIGRIELRSLVGQGGAAPPVETLNAFRAIGLPVACGDEVAPPKDLAADGSSPFGLVDRNAWHWAFNTLTNRRPTTEELEAILASEDVRKVEVAPDGSVRAAMEPAK